MRERMTDGGVLVIDGGAVGWIDSGARLVGGCCGTRPEHTRAVRERVDGRAAAVSA
jgi:S-methylmethionine-dependent homocysteine/selenocysteine methylase